MKHHHKCPNCDFVWSHGEEARGKAKAHRCPRCKGSARDCWYRYTPTLEEAALLAEGGNNPDRRAAE